MASSKRGTPISLPVHQDALEEISSSLSEITSSSRSEQTTLKAQCLQRDGFRCCLSGSYDIKSICSRLVQAPIGARVAITECAHILPFALREFNEKSAIETENKAAIWWALYRYFPALKNKIDSATINQRQNAITMIDALHGMFGNFKLALWPTSTVGFLSYI